MPSQKLSSSPSNSFSVAVLGTGSVGKTSCTIRFLHNEFSSVVDATIENFYSSKVRIDGTDAYLEITDTAGQDEYEGLRETTYRSCEGFLFVYDLTSRSSFESIRKLFDELMLVRNRQDVVPCVFFGNKKDLLTTQQREVSAVEASNLATNLGVYAAMEGSALDGTAVNDAFANVVRAIKRDRATLEERLRQLRKNQKNPLPPKPKGISSSSKTQISNDVDMFTSAARE